jgi:F0F1-type ATP synthase membrane subunit a
MLSAYLAASPTAIAIRASLAIFVVILVVIYMIWRRRRG